MILKRYVQFLPPLLVGAALALSTAVPAQQQQAPAAQKPAAPKPAAKPVTANPAAQATLLGQYGDWGAYTASPGGRKVCFALSKPTSSSDNPPNRRTAANVVYMFVSSRPAEKVKEEVSMLVTGYALKSNSDASLTIGSTPFTMYTQNDGAWVKNAADEAKLVEAMRKGADMTVKATTSRGTQTTDTFSLKGISQALDRVTQECN
jgi:invasion protein IalB